MGRSLSLSTLPELHKYLNIVQDKDARVQSLDENHHLNDILNQQSEIAKGITAQQLTEPGTSNAHDPLGIDDSDVRVYKERLHMGESCFLRR